MRLLPLFVFLCACGSGKSDDSGTTDAGPATFTEVRDDILLMDCAIAGGCHLPGDDGDVDGGLAWDPSAPDAVYDTIVNATATTGLVLVTPGDIDNSFLITKITAEQGTDQGDPMPPPFGLSAEKTARIVSWVEDGAPNN